MPSAKLEVTPTVAVLPAQILDADTLRPLTFGLALTLNVAVLLLDIALVQEPPLAILVMVTVVDPAVARSVEGMVNVPFDAPMVRVAVWFVTVFAQLRL